MTRGEEPPLGRYTPADEVGPLHPVVLMGLPLRLLAQARERHDELLREFALLALSDHPSTASVPAAFLELVEVLGVRYAAATARPDAQIEDALQRGLTTIDLTYEVPASVVQAAADLEHWLVKADEFCEQEQLLALPRTALQLQFGRWYIDEFRRQVAGEAPQPWTGPLEA